MLNKRLMSPSLSLFASMAIISCANPQPKPAREPIATHKTSGAAAGPAKAAAKAAPRKITKIMSAEAEYNHFYARLAIPENEYTEKDRATLNAMAGAPAGGTIHEAALVVGLLRDVLTPGVSAPNPSRDHSANTANPTAVVAPAETTMDTKRVLESRAREKGVDVTSALAGNAYLKNQAIYNMAWDAVRIEGNSQTFAQNLAIVLKTETKLWTDFAKRLGIEPQPESQPVITDTTPAPPASDKGETAVTSDPTVPVSAAVAEEAVKAMGKSQDWAQKENYEKAVVEARKVAPGTEQYAAAQENIKTWSNKAVQELRRQAANQFRSGTSTNDPAAKKVYLTKARNSLQEALTKYPEASTLDTVKENLEIISQELERPN